MSAVLHLTPLQAKAMLATVRPRDIAGKIGPRIATEELGDLVAIDGKIKRATTELETGSSPGARS